MAKKQSKRAGLAGRGGGIAPGIDAGWVAATEAALSQFIEVAAQADARLQPRAEFAARWTIDWLIAYTAGWVAGDQSRGGSLGTTLRHAATGADAMQLPPHLVRVLLAIATESALKTSQAFLGEDKPKTPPNLVQSIATYVESLRFDESGTQLRTLDAAIGDALPLLRKLLPEACPTVGTIRDWHREWRAKQDGLPAPKPGRPRNPPATV